MTRERAIEVLKAWDLNWSDSFTSNEFEQAFAMAISALSADGEYIRKSELLGKTVRRNNIWNEVTNSEGKGLEEIVNGLPTYSFPEELSEDGTLTVHVSDGSKVTRVFVMGDNIFGGLYYPDSAENEGDTVSRAAYEQIMWERDTAIQQLKELGYGLGEKPKENKGDLISRQAVLDELEKLDWQDLYLPSHFKQILDDVPSVENKGKWEKIWRTDCECSEYVCSKCGCGEDYWTDFCPNCGADMREIDIILEPYKKGE